MTMLTFQHEAWDSYGFEWNFRFMVSKYSLTELLAWLWPLGLDFNFSTHFPCFQISYQSIESSDPGINVPGPRRTVSKLRNETYHMFSGLHPGTTYLVSVRARTTKGFGQTALTEITTNISGKNLSWLRFFICLAQVAAKSSLIHNNVPNVLFHTCEQP